MKINKKTILKVIGFLAVGGVFGFIAAMSLNALGNSEYINVFEEIHQFLITNNIYLFPALLFLFFTPVYIIGYQGKKKLEMVKNLPDELYDESIETAEKKIDISLAINSVFMVLNFILMGISFNPRVSHVFIGLGLFLVNILVVSFYEISTIRFIQENDQRLKGDPVSLRFRKDFFESCDEAEKQKILKTSYDTFNLSRNVALGLLVTSILGQMILNTGIFAIIISGFMLLSIVAGYSYYAIFK